MSTTGEAAQDRGRAEEIVKSRTVQASAAALGDKACIYCGTSLAGLTASDRCPDCGKLAVDSLLGDNLRDAEAPWLRTVLRGLTIAMCGQLAMAVSAILFVALAIAMLADAHRSILAEFPAYMTYSGLVGWAMFTVGAWLISTREPSDALIARRRGVAWVVRISTIVTLITAARGMLLRDVSVPSPLFNLAAWTHDVAQIVAYMSVFLLIRRVIERTPRREVRRVLTTMTCLSLPVGLISADVLLPRLAIRFPNDQIPAAILLGIGLVKFAFALAAAYTLLISGKAIRRTIGDWT